MCIIVCSNDGAIPTLSDLLKMQSANPDGIGIAWREPTTVRFERGIDLVRAIAVLDKIRRKGLAYILHFRMSTIGESGDPALCHPFPITTDTRLLFAKRGNWSHVIAHNGHYGRWQSLPGLPPAAQKDRQWSDTAAIAYSLAKNHRVAIQTKPVLGTSYQRFATLSVLLGVKTFGDWQAYDTEKRILVSNNYWRWRFTYDEDDADESAETDACGLPNWSAADDDRCVFCNKPLTSRDGLNACRKCTRKYTKSSKRHKGMRLAN